MHLPQSSTRSQKRNFLKYDGVTIRLLCLFPLLITNRPNITFFEKVGLYLQSQLSSYTHSGALTSQPLLSVLLLTPIVLTRELCWLAVKPRAVCSGTHLPLQPSVRLGSKVRAAGAGRDRRSVQSRAAAAASDQRCRLSVVCQRGGRHVTARTELN